jgi:hypothetical protein
MRRIRSLATQTPAIVISLLAIAFSLGGSAYASTHLGAGHSHPSQPGAAQSAAAAPGAVTHAASVSWHTLGLLNGWTSSNGSFNSGNPKVSLASGIVYLSGSLHQPTPGSAEFAVLPRADRPTHNMWITVYTNGDTSGTLFIGASGEMEAFSATSCGSGDTAQCFTSLATVSYPVNS